MRVLYVSHTGLVSGGEGALLDLLAALPDDVQPILASPTGRLADAASGLGVPVIPIPPVSASLRLGVRQTTVGLSQFAIATREVRNVVRDQRPDIVHANSTRAGLITSAALRGSQTTHIVHCHDVMPHSRMAILVRTALTRSAHAIFTVSDYVARPWRPSRARVEVVYNPINTNRFDPAGLTRAGARAALGLSPEDLIVGVVAQITPWKGQDTTIEALAALRDRFPRLRLMIVGEAKFTSRETRHDNRAYLEGLRALVQELELEDRVEFWSERIDPDVVTRALDVALSPSWEEPFGRSAVEAMALQTPVVATNVGGPPEYVDDGVTGRLVAPREAVAWAGAIGSLLDSPAAAKSMAVRASETVRRRFDRVPYARSIRDLYMELAPDAAVTPGGSPRVRNRRLPRNEPKDADPTPDVRLRLMYVEHSSIVSGGQHSLLELMRSMSAEHDVVLACPAGPLSERATTQGFTVLQLPESQLSFRISPLGTPRQLLRTLCAAVWLRQHIRRHRPDVIHANSPRAALLASGPLTKRKLVVHVRDLPPAGMLTRVIAGFILLNSSAVIAVSKASAERSSPRRSRRRPAVVDNPVDSSRFDPELHDIALAREALGVADGPVLSIIAQITPWKGHQRAVRVLERVRLRYPEAKLLIVGEAKFVTSATRFDNVTYTRELTALVRESGLEQSVLFLGERDDIPTVLAATDVLLVPSTEEPFGRTVIEAMAMAAPVVATNAGGPAEILRWGVDGFFLPPDDVEAWARAVLNLVARGRRPESRRYAIDRFSPERHAAAVLRVYRRVTEGTLDQPARWARLRP